jgi:hypothetical protein
MRAVKSGYDMEAVNWKVRIALEALKSKDWEKVTNNCSQDSLSPNDIRTRDLPNTL